MKHIFEGSINKEWYWYHSGYIEYEIEPYILTFSQPDSWEEICSNENIEFPLSVGDKFRFKDEELKIIETVANEDGSLTCRTNKVLLTIPDEVKRMELNKKIDDFREQVMNKKKKLDNDDVLPLENKKSWWQRIFG